MNMKEHILAALREQFDRWEELLVSMNDEQITTLYVFPDWSTKDVIAHLWAWQQISIARMEAALRNREPEYPKWIARLGEDWEENFDQTNALIYKNNHDKSWAEVHQNWREGYLRLIESGDKVTEINLLGTGIYPWPGGYSLALILIASYDHHQEHFDKLTKWLQEHK